MAGFQVGVAVRDITPPDGWIREGRIWLWGYGSRTGPCEGVHDPISVRALAIRDDAGDTLALAALDLGAVDAGFTDNVRRRVGRTQRIARENICIHVTHTHGAPVPVNIPTWQPGFTVPDPEYMALVEDRVVGAIEDACRVTEAATIRFGRGQTGIAFDRHFGAPGFHDPTLDVLKITDENDGVIATVFFTACHPVCMSDFNKVYADFPGVTRHQVEREMGGAALFVQGYCGISNPVVRDPKTTGLALSDDVLSVLDGPMQELSGPVGAWSSKIQLPFQPLPVVSVRERAMNAGGIHARWAAAMAAADERIPDVLPVELQLFRIGAGPGAWFLAASSHEVTSDFAAPVRSLRPDDHVTPIAFSNSEISYVPSVNVLSGPERCDTFPFCENYEGGISFAWYGHRAPLAMDVDTRFVEGSAALFARVCDGVDRGGNVDSNAD